MKKKFSIFTGKSFDIKHVKRLHFTFQGKKHIFVVRNLKAFSVKIARLISHNEKENFSLWLQSLASLTNINKCFDMTHEKWCVFLCVISNYFSVKKANLGSHNLKNYFWNFHDWAKLFFLIVTTKICFFHWKVVWNDTYKYTPRFMCNI